MKKILEVLFLLLVLTGCMANVTPAFESNPAGFFLGIWHGWLAPLSLILQIFNPEHSIFELNNTGFGYEIGFYMAVISGFGGLSLLRKKK
jgi:ABC-type multidrug transport system permease subunit